ncbi:MAG: NifB/NifX family molybdenum-iron cluster-binding protein [Candidatus Sumerlaeia bacterium]
MRIAIPVEDGKLAGHFGHCPQFMLVDADPAAATILKQEVVDAPQHAPGVLPPWLADHGAAVVIAGNMGARARTLFESIGVQVVLGAPPETPEWLAREFLAGRLVSGEGSCHHDHSCS